MCHIAFRYGVFLSFCASVVAPFTVLSAMDWSPATHDLAAADFNGDHRDDLLVVARDPWRKSGIVLSGVGGYPDRVQQVWRSDHLGIDWSGKRHELLVGSFSTGKCTSSHTGTSCVYPEDLLLQAREGSAHHLLFTDHVAVTLNEVAQRFGDPHLGFDWSATSHRILVAHLNRDNYHDLYLQPASPAQQNHIVFSTTLTGFDDPSQPAQSWPANWAGFDWAVTDASVHAGDFNGDGVEDLLVQGRTPPGDPYAPGRYGILAGQTQGGFVPPDGSEPAPWMTWARQGFRVPDWSPESYALHVGNFNNDSYDDVLLQPVAGGDAYVVFFGPAADAASWTVARLPAGAQGLGWAIEDARLVPGDFNGDGRTELYYMPTAAGGANQLVTIPGASEDGVAELDVVSAPAPELDPGSGSGTYLAGTAVGATPAQFAVNDLGAATYRVPLQVPPGVRGMQPELAVEYDSTAGNGLLGMGWRLTGILEIRRCAALADPLLDGVADGVDLDADDRYCLNGQRLVATATPGEFRTEIESLRRVRASGQAGSGPQRFMVEDRDGLTWLLGATSASRVPADATGTSGDVLVYLASSVSDRYGNSMAYEWHRDQDSLAYRPEAIRWSGASGQVVGRVEFAYEGRADTGQGWYAGSRTARPWRLATVRTYTRARDGGAADIAVRTYHLDYAYSSVSQLSHLVRLTECEAGTGTCLGATRVTVETGERGFLADYETPGVTDAELAGLQALDVDNSGIADYVYLRRISDNDYEWAVRRNGLTGPRMPNAARAWDWDRNVAFPIGYRAIALDYNGDGHADLIQPSNDRDDATTLVQLLAGGANGWTVSDTTLDTEGRGFWASGVGADINGDGRDDLASAAGPWVEVYLSDGQQLAAMPVRGAVPGELPDRGAAGPTGAVLRPLNFNGDGRADLLTMTADCERAPYVGLVCQSYQWLIYAWLDDADAELTVAYQFPPGDYIRNPKLLDANGDGLTDLLFHNAINQRWELHVSDGRAFRLAWYGARVDVAAQTDGNYLAGRLLDKVAAADQTISVELNAPALEHARVLDYDHDGADDLLLVVPDQANLQVLTGANAENFAGALIDTGLPKPAAADIRRLRLLDVGGDGVVDLLWPDAGGSYRLYHGRGPNHALLTGIEDGLGARTRVRYGVLTDPGIYEGAEGFVADTAAVDFPYRHFAGPVTVVEESAVGDGVGTGAVVTRYEYAGAKAHSQGRGFLGFARVSAWNLNRDLVTENRFAQRFPYQGMTVESVLRLPDDAGGAAMTTISLPGLGEFSYPAVCEEDVMAPDCQAFVNPQQQSDTTAPAARVVSRTMSELAHIITAHGEYGASRLPYVARTTDLQYGLSAAAGPAVTVQRRVVTTYASEGNPVDAFGNATRIVVATDNGQGGAVHQLTVANTWVPRTDVWCPALLSESIATRSEPGTPAVVRTEHFDYDQHCALAQSTIQPDSTAARIEHRFAYDAAGNRVEHTVSAAETPPRTASSEFGSTFHGRFITRESNARGHAVDIGWDPRFGHRASESLAGRGGAGEAAAALWRYDGFGRLASRRGPRPGVREERLLQWCASAGCDAPMAALRLLSLRGDGQEFVQELDALGRTVHASRLAMTAGRIHVDRRFDSLGREYATSRPYFDWESVHCYRYREFDALNRLIYEQQPASVADCASMGPPTAGVRPAAVGRQAILTHDLAETDGVGVQRDWRFPGDAATPGTSTLMVRDVRDRPVRVVEAGGDQLATASYAWYADGNVREVRGPDGTVAALEYDSLGHLVTASDPHFGQRFYNHNALGELTLAVDGARQLTRYEYDGLGRVTRRVQRYNFFDAQDPEQLVTEWRYDTAPGAGAGRLASAVGPYRFGDGEGAAALAIDWHYDEFGEVRDEVWRLQDAGARYTLWLSRAFDELGRIEALTFPSQALDGGDVNAGTSRFSLGYAHDGRGYLKRVTDADGRVHFDALAADAAGHYAQFRIDAGAVTVRREHDAATGRITGLAATSGSDWLQQRVYQWSGNGDLTWREDLQSGRQQSLDYDSLGRLAAVELRAGSGPPDTDGFEYDAAGNLLRTTATGLTLRYAVDRPQAVENVADGLTGEWRQYAYDANGNVIARGDQQLDWNASNQLASVQGSGWETRLDYGPTGEMYRQVHIRNGSGRRRLRVGPDFEIALDDAGAPEFLYRIRAAGEVVAVVARTSGGFAQSTYLYRDALGSVVGLQGGGQLAGIGYRSWGEPWQGDGLPDEVAPDTGTGALTHGFTGHEHLPDSGLIHLGGRVLDPSIGRFLSPDPLVQFPLSPHGLNRYAYASNRPATFVDPNGFSIGGWLSDFGKDLFFTAPGAIIGGTIGGLTGLGVAEGGAIGLSVSLTGYRARAGQGRSAITSDAGPGYSGSNGLGRREGLALSLAGAQTVARESAASLENLRVQIGLRGLHHAAGAGSSGRDGVAPGPDPVGEAAVHVARLLAPRTGGERDRRPGRVYLVGHPVNGLGPLHTAIEYRDEHGVFWISAGPEGWSVEGFERLAGGVGSYTNGVRPTDVPENNTVLAEVHPAPGLSAGEYFERLGTAASLYCNCADYDLFPELGNGYNSNSYTRGLIDATGGSTSYDTSTLVGGGTPLPPAYFGY